MEKLSLCTKNVSGIYMIFNLQNGKKYIGSTNDLYERSYSHLYHLVKNNHVNAHLQCAWNKYGGENFVISILEYCKESERLKRESFYIDTLNPEYNISKVDESACINTEEKNKKISDSITKSWKEGKLKDRRDKFKCWSISCYIYNTDNWSLIKECTSFKEANQYLQLNDFEVRNETIGTRLFRNKYVIYLDKIDNPLDIKNRICEDIFYYNSMDITKKKYLIAETSTGELYYFRKLPHLIEKFGSSKSTLTRKLKTATRENPFILNDTIKIYYSYKYIKHEAV